MTQSKLLMGAGQYVEAERVLRVAYSAVVQTDADSVQAGVLARELAFVQRALGRVMEAEQMYRRSAAVLAHWLGEAHPAVLFTLSKLAALYLDASATGDAERLLRTKLRPLLQGLPSNSTLALDILRNEALLSHRKQRLTEARQTYETVLRGLGTEPRHFQMRAVILNNIGNVHLDAGDPVGARSYMKEAAATLESALGPAHPQLGIMLVNIAQCHIQTHQYAEAEKLLRKAIGIFSNVLGSNQKHVGLAFMRYGEVLARMKCKAESRYFRKRGADILKAASDFPERSRHLVDIDDLQAGHK